MTDQEGRQRRTLQGIAVGFGCLVVAALADNVRGPILPKLAGLPGVGLDGAGSFMASGYFGATLVTFLLIWVLNRWPARQVVIAACLYCLPVFALTTTVASRSGLLGIGFLLGGVICAFGTMSNVLVIENAPDAHRGRWLASLHTCYGVAAMFATWVSGRAAAQGILWAVLYLGLMVPAGGLAVSALLMRTSAGTRPAEGTGTPAVRRESLRLDRLAVLAIITPALYVAGELTAAAWLTTYLVTERGHTVETAAPYLTGFFLAMMISRLLCVVFTGKVVERVVPLLALLVPAAMLLAGRGGPAWLLSLAGLCGPFYPLFLARASHRFPDRWRSVWILAISAMNLAICLCHFLVGQLAEKFGTGRAFYLPAILFILTACVLALFGREDRRQSARQASGNL